MKSLSKARPLIGSAILVTLTFFLMAVAQTPPETSPTPPSDSSKMYEYREKGLRALGDGIFATAARFFTAYRNATEFREPEFADATALLIQAHLERGALKEAKEAELLHTQKSPGCKEPFYVQNLTCWRSALTIRQGQPAKAAEDLEVLLDSTRFPEISHFARQLLGEAYIQLARWKEAQQLFDAVVEAEASEDRILQAQLALIRVYVAQEDYSAARELLKTLDARDDVAPELIVLQTILIDMASGNLDAAMNAFDQVASSLTPGGGHRENWWSVVSQLAAKLVALERWKDAVRVIPAAETLAPTSDHRIALRFQLAEVYQSVDDSQKAIEVLESLKETVQGTSDEVSVALKLAQIARKMDKLQEAAAHFDTVVKNENASDDVRYRAAMSRGWCLNELKDAKAAGDAFIQAAESISDASKKATALLFAGDAALKVGDDAVATERYQTVADTLANTPVAATARLRQAQTLAKQSLFAEAIKSYRTFLEENPQDDRVDDAMFELGVALTKNNAPLEAVEALNQFVKEFPAHENAPQALLEAYRSARTASHLETAMRLLTKVCTEYSSSDLYATALYHRIHTAFLLGDTDLALTDAEQFVRDFPNLTMATDVMLWLGDHFRAVGDYSRATDHYLRVTLVHPDLPQAQNALLAAAKCALKDDETDRAETLIGQLLEANPENKVPEIHARAAFMLGNILSAKTDFEPAIEAYRQVVEIAPESEEARIATGRVADLLFSLGEPENIEEAAEIYQRLLADEEVTPQLEASLKFRWARTLEALERNDEALDAYLEVVFDYDIDVRDGRVRDWYYFGRSADNAARILVAKGQVDAAARIYERIKKSGIPYAAEAAERAQEIRRAHDILN